MFQLHLGPEKQKRSGKIVPVQFIIAWVMLS